KVRAIAAACEAGDREKVVEAAITKDGLICDRVRRIAWPFLLGSRTSSDGSSFEKRRDWRDLPPHVDEDQVKLDVNRSFIYYPTNMTPRQLEQRKKQLLELIVEVLRRHPMLGYFQGFHDICQLILLVLGPVLAVPAVEHIALLRIRDFMLPEMAPAIDHLLLLYPLLKAEHPKLCAHISNTQPFFALAATLTLYAHEIQEYSNIARLFDAFLALDPVFPLYLFAQIIISRSTELFSIPEDEPEMLHSILSHLPKPLDLETWITEAIHLLKSRPPESLSYWHCVSYLSVLKTSKKNSSLQEAETLFKKHCRQLEFRKKKKEVLVKLNKNKGTVIFVGVSVLVGIGGVVWGVWGRRMG
ncbi:rab-GTPase-TBC domain-containing protein, partial [Pyronema omphalodes]